MCEIFDSCVFITNTVRQLKVTNIIFISLPLQQQMKGNNHHLNQK